MVKENLEYVQQRIEEACKRSNRTSSEVTLIAVSKTKPVSMIEDAIDYGIVDFGENKVQEMTNKIEVIQKPLRWHLIGHLQRNKVKYIVDKAYLIHSVDSLRLAEQIEEEAAKKQVVAKILIEVNIAGEDTKFGVAENEVLPLLQQIKDFPHVQVEGLMTIAPYVDDPQENRVHFKKLRNLFVDIKSKNIDNIHMNILSMGMTGDYEVAIEEGATMIRVGTGIFGERNYLNK